MMKDILENFASARQKQVLNRVDVAVSCSRCPVGKTSVDEELIHILKEKEIPYLVVYNKADLLKTKDEPAFFR